MSGRVSGRVSGFFKRVSGLCEWSSNINFLDRGLPFWCV